MRTARLLTVSQHALHRGVCPGGWCLPGGVVSAQEGCLPSGREVSAQGGVSAGGVADPPVNRVTDRCRNITLSQRSCGR